MLIVSMGMEFIIESKETIYFSKNISLTYNIFLT